MADKAWTSLPAASADTTTEIPTATHGGVWKKFNLWAWLTGLIKSTANMTASPLQVAVSQGRWLQAIAVTNNTGSAQTFNAGTSLGGNDVVPAGEVPAGTTVTFPVWYFAASAFTLHLSPISGGSITFNFLIV